MINNILVHSLSLSMINLEEESHVHYPYNYHKTDNTEQYPADTDQPSPKQLNCPKYTLDLDDADRLFLVLYTVSTRTVVHSNDWSCIGHSP